MTKNTTVSFLGPISGPNEKPRGGYQACNRRTMLELNSLGITVHAIPYPFSENGFLRKLVTYVVGFLRVIWSIFNTSKQIVHITGLYKYFIYPELLFVLMSKLRNNVVIYDVRAGSMMLYYEGYGEIYRLMFRSVLRLSDVVMVEGVDYIPFVESITGEKPYYFPNHVKSYLSDEVDEREGGVSQSEINLIFAGRVVSDKGIEDVLAVAGILRQRGYLIKLFILGGGDEQYISSLKCKFSHVDNLWLGLKSSDEVLDYFSNSHFFLFPSTHSGEGHSNALTESMAVGCVPIVSDNGFNRTIVGNDELVESKGVQPEVYADKIDTFLREDRWSALSQSMISRYHSSFNTSVVVGSLVQEYGRIWRDTKWD